MFALSFPASSILDEILVTPSWIYCIILWTVINQHVYCFEQALCPPYHGYLESGNQCLTFLNNCSDFSKSRKKCQSKGGDLVSLILNRKHFYELCDYATKRLPNHSAIYLNARRRSNSRREPFLWNGDNSVILFFDKAVNVTETNCLEMTVFKAGCRLREAICSTRNRVLCEFTNANPCLNNNGDCEGTCTPRGRGKRVCTCPEGKIADGIKCVNNQVKLECPSDHWLSDEDNVCIKKFRSSGKNSKADKLCGKYVGMAELKSQSQMMNYCNALRKIRNIKNSKREYWVEGRYDYSSKQFSATWHSGAWTLDELCPNENHYRFSKASQNVVLVVGKNMCCLKIVKHDTQAHYICNTAPPDVCRGSTKDLVCSAGSKCVTKSGYRKYACTCPIGYEKGNSTDGCVEILKGCGRSTKCHQKCKLVNKTEDCSCFPGYALVNGTECRYTDKCKFNDGENGCPIHKKYHKCDADDNDDDDDDDDVDDDDNDDFQLKTGHIVLIFLLVGISALALSFCCRAIYLSCTKIRKSESESEN